MHIVNKKPVLDEIIILRVLSQNMPHFNISLNALRHFDRIKNQTINLKTQYILPEVTQDYAIDLLKKTLYDVSMDPQSSLNQGYNKWIMKPHDASRGIGIQTKSDLDGIVNLINDKNTKFIVQK